MRGQKLGKKGQWQMRAILHNSVMLPGTCGSASITTCYVTLLWGGFGVCGGAALCFFGSSFIFNFFLSKKAMCCLCVDRQNRHARWLSGGLSVFLRVLSHVKNSCNIKFCFSFSIGDFTMMMNQFSIFIF